MSAVTTRQVERSDDAELEALSQILHSIQDMFLNGEQEAPAEVEIADQRASPRVELKAPVRVTPAVLAGGRVTLLDGPQQAETANLSTRGLAFAHHESFMHFFAKVDFERPGTSPLSLLAEIQWTLQEAKGCYLTGARFIGMLENR
jgi:hypothetical protein